MLVPRIWSDNLFDDWFEFPQWPDMDKKLYGKHADRLMKTDVHDHDDHFDVAIDLPGFKKDEIKLELNSGYLTVSVSKTHEQENKGKAIRKERYSGSMQRSFYVGEQITEEDVKAKYEDGVLKLEIPKKEEKKIPEKKTIMIEG